MTQHLAELGRHALKQHLTKVIGEVILGQVDARAAEHGIGHPADPDDNAHGTPQHVKVELAPVQRDTCRLFASGDVIVPVNHLHDVVVGVGHVFGRVVEDGAFDLDGAAEVVGDRELHALGQEVRREGLWRRLRFHRGHGQDAVHYHFHPLAMQFVEGDQPRQHVHEVRHRDDRGELRGEIVT